jgi:hypothetical protein
VICKSVASAIILSGRISWLKIILSVKHFIYLKSTKLTRRLDTHLGIWRQKLHSTDLQQIIYICDQLFFSTTDNIIYNRSLNNISSQDLCHKPIFSHTVYLCIDSPWSTVPIPAKIELHVLREVWKRGGSFLQSLSYHLYNSVFVVTTLTYKYPTICIVQIVGITETRGTIKLCGA